MILARKLKNISETVFWRPSCPPFCMHVTDMSEINFNVLNQLLDLKNQCVAAKIICLEDIEDFIL